MHRSADIRLENIRLGLGLGWRDASQAEFVIVGHVGSVARLLSLPDHRTKA